MSIELQVLHTMLGNAGVELFNATVAAAKHQAEVKRLTEELKAAQDRLTYGEKE